jgi:hypothetical protein
MDDLTYALKTCFGMIGLFVLTVLVFCGVLKLISSVRAIWRKKKRGQARKSFREERVTRHLIRQVRNGRMGL